MATGYAASCGAAPAPACADDFLKQHEALHARPPCPAVEETPLDVIYRVIQAVRSRDMGDRYRVAQTDDAILALAKLGHKASYKEADEIKKHREEESVASLAKYREAGGP